MSKGSVMKLQMAAVIWAFLWGCMLMPSFGEGQEEPASDIAPLGLAKYDTVIFNLKGARPSTYKDFIKKAREKLKSNKSSHGIPLLYAHLKPSERYLLVNLTSLSGVTMTLGINRTNVRVVGYQGLGGKASFFSNEFKEAKKYLFKSDPNPTKLPFNGSYVSLESIAGDRSKIPLGPDPLDRAIKDLYRPGIDPRFVKRARALIIATQMVSEAARFALIENWLARTFSRRPPTVTPGCFVKALEDSWSKLSFAVRGADAQGKFKKPVKVCNVTYTNVSQVRGVISLLLNKKKKITDDDDDQIGGQDSHPLKIISSGAVIDRGSEYGGTSNPSVAAIVGHHDLCLQAVGGSLRPKECNRDIEEQKWALYGDGTIRPNWDPRNCLTPTYDSAVERNVVAINTCTGLLGQRWFITEEGMILGRSTQDVMEVRGADSNDHEILLHKPNGSPSQLWRLAF